MNEMERAMILWFDRMISSSLLHFNSARSSKSRRFVVLQELQVQVQVPHDTFWKKIYFHSLCAWILHLILILFTLFLSSIMDGQDVSIYLDYNATTPIDKEVAEAMKPYLFSFFGTFPPVFPSFSHAQYPRPHR
jgi:hypothetical protein